VAVVDTSGRLYPMLDAIFDGYNATQMTPDGTVKGPRFVLESTPVAGRQADDVRVDLSDRVRREELFAFVELPAPPFHGTPKIRYYTNSPTFQPLPRLLEEIVGRLVIVERVGSSTVDAKTMLELLQPAKLDRLELLTRAGDGRVAPAKVSDPIRSFVTPLVLMMLMFLIVISTASPLLNSVMEEKMTRISEVLLGSLSPFELMAGKLVGVIVVSMALSTLYLSGAYAFAVYHGYGDAVTAGQIVWFVIYLILAMTIYGSLFIAIGAAATDLKDAQALMTPCMLLFMAPVFIWLPVVRAGRDTTVASLVPFATPVLATFAR
jgi:ABC-2 type transport system permease protein